MKTKITKILIMILIMATIYVPVAFCSSADTVRMKIDNGTLWTNITVSESYEECLSLNSTSSTLGTSALEAHLTTDYDWSAMAVFSASQYGKSTNNTPTSTNNNKSGLYDIGELTQTTGLLSGATSTTTEYISYLFDSTTGNPKKYVNMINTSTGIDDSGRKCIPFVLNGGTLGWLSSWTFAGTDTRFPVSIKNGLFGVRIGINGYYGAYGNGETNVTFRPVIWN